MRRTWVQAAATVVLLVALVGAATAFDAFGSVGPGTHIGSAIDAVAEVYGVEATRPEVVKTMPVYGVPTYRWPRFSAAELFCEAARDVDIFYFGTLYPHAQTPEFGYGRELSEGRLRDIELSALWDYLRHMAGTIERARALFADGKPREATYLLGFLTHSYQDLWAHRGITNGMHKALLAWRGIDVDRDADRVAALKERLPAWLADLPALLGDQGPAFDSYIRSTASVAELSLPERKRVLDHGRDIFVHGPIYVLFTTKSEKALRYYERLEWDVDALDRLLLDRASLQAILALDGKAALAGFLESRGYKF